MRSDRPLPASGITQSGLSMGEILALPPRERRIINWMLRNPGSTQREIAAFLSEDEATTNNELEALIDQGYIQTSEVAGETRYTVKLAAKRGIHLPEILSQALTPGKPLAILVNPSGEIAVRAGSSFELGVTVSNQGSSSALIDVFFDESSDFPQQWCLAPEQRLALDSGQSSEVVFQFQVPLTANPGSYDYLLRVDAQQHYPEDTPIDQDGRIVVLPFVQEAQTVSDPTFALQPPTSSTAPFPLQPGVPLEVLALVYNRSNRVDRFWLTCPDLAPNWYTVTYPEGLPTAGMLLANDGLELNPGEQGQIQLRLTPPLDTYAGVYSPTARLYSVNNPDLVLLDVVYLQVLPIYLLTVELLTLVGKVKHQSGLFELRLHNGGNTVREVLLHVRGTDEEEICTYTLTPAHLRLLPGESAVVQLEVQPTKRRPFYGRLLNFVVEVEDVQHLPLINDRFTGVLVWEPRPWWQFLLLVLAIIGVVGLTVFFIWWLLTRPPARPQILEFSPTSASYQAVSNEGVRLNWRITHPNKLQTLKIEGVSPDGVVTSAPVVYDFSQTIPNPLRNFCNIERRELICQNVPTDARQAGDYVFELTLEPKPGRRLTASSVKTNTIRVEPVPLPKITELTSTQPVYQEARFPLPITRLPANPSPQTASTPPSAAPSPPQNNQIRLNWQISNPGQIQELRLIGRTPEGEVNSPLKRYIFNANLPQELEEFCKLNFQELNCKNVPTNANEPGTYIFELTVVPRQGQPEPLASQKTEPVKINAQKIPTKIEEFKINGTEALPKYVVRLEPKKPVILTISWKVTGGKDLKVELLPAPGTVLREGTIPYPLAEEPGSETLTLQVTDGAGEQISRAVTIETVPIPAPSPAAALPTLRPSQAPLPPAPSTPDQGALPGIPALPAPAEAGAAPGTASPAASPGATASPSPSPTAPPPPGSSPPLPPGRNSPPPAELPPQFN